MAKKRAKKKQQHPLVARLIMAARRFGVAGGALVFVLWLGAWFVLSGAATRSGQWLVAQSYDISARAGFAVKDILVEGRVYTDPDVLRGLINIQGGDPLFSFHPESAREQIEKISWVRRVQIERRWPDTLYIGLTERVPLALWQYDGRVRVIDAEGVVLTDNNLERFKDLPIAVGGDAPAHIAGLLDMIAAEPLIAQRLEAATWVGDRRWDLKLKNGIKIKLPEDDVGFALRRLALAQEEDGLLDKDLTVINARERDRLTVRTRPGAVQTYRAGMSGEL